MNNYIVEMEKELNGVIEYLNKELNKVRTGRASVHMLDGVMVSAYGNMSAINTVALLSVPEARQLVVKPFDPSLLEEIESAINSANLGLNPNSDGEILRINIPALTEETRKQLVKEVKAIAEQSKIRVRNIRQDFNNKVKKDEELTDDVKKGLEKQIQDLVNKFNKEIETIADNKEKEVMTI